MIDQHLSDELLSARVDGALDAVEVTTVEAHLAGCAECARRLELLRATSRAVAGLPGEEPGPLDLSFLPGTPSNVVVLPASRGWHPPRWAAPVLAAAAVLVVAVGIGSQALRQPAPTSGAATALGQQGSDKSGGARASIAAGPALAPTTNGSAAGPSVPGAAPGRGVNGDTSLFTTATSPTTATHTFSTANGATVRLTTSNGNAVQGQGIQLSMMVQAGSATVDARGLDVIVRRASESTVLLGAGAQTIPPGHVASLYGTWVAGQLGGSGTTPGDYLVEAHVRLTDGTDLTVSVNIHVS